MIAISKIKGNKIIIPDEILEIINKNKNKNKIAKWKIDQGIIKIELENEKTLEDFPEDCKVFYNELDNIIKNVEDGNGIKIDMHELAKEHKIEL